MNLEKAMSSGDEFIPDSVLEMLTRFPRIAGDLKRRPDTFIVEEQTIDDVRLSVSTKSDYPDIWDDRAEGDMVALVMVKRRHTTPSAIRAVMQMIGLNPHHYHATYSGLKDWKADTSQLVVIVPKHGHKLDYDAIVRCCMPDMAELDRRGGGVFIKDARRTHRSLRPGLLIGNNFDIKIFVKGFTPDQLQQYLEPRIDNLRRECGTIMIPNAFGRQRLGRRQNLFGVGYDFILNGPEAGIKRFLTEVTASESPEACNIRTRIAREWADAEEKARQTGTTVARQIGNLQGMLEILEEGGPNPGQQNFQRYNLVIEHKIVQGLLQYLDYERTLRSLQEDFSLWVGAYQSLFFNQVLGDVLDGKITLAPEDAANGNHGEPLIPLFMDDKRAIRFYRKYCPQAVPERMDPTVRRIFLQPWKKKGACGPRRPLFVSVQDLEYECGVGERPGESMARLKFRLRSGAYATTFLGMLFDFDANQNNNGRDGGAREGDES